MTEETQTHWHKSISSFSKVSDGFWIIGYTKQDKTKFAFGLAEDLPLMTHRSSRIRGRQWAEKNASKDEYEN